MSNITSVVIEKEEKINWHVSEPLIVFDVETTGLNEDKDRIIQLAMLKVHPNGLGEVFNQYFNPCMSRQDQLNAYKIHKISPDKLLSEKPFKAHAQDILKHLEGVSTLVGHNVCFDWGFLCKEFQRLKRSSDDISNLEPDESKLFSEHDFTLVDTYKMSIVACPDLEKYRLIDLANHFGISTSMQPVVKYSVSSPKKNKGSVVKIQTNTPEKSGLHDALMDVLVTKEVLYENIYKIYKNYGLEESGYINFFKLDKRFTYSTKCLSLIDEQIALNNREKLSHIGDIARETMSSLKMTKGKLLKELSYQELQNDISFLNTRNSKHDHREKILRETLIILDKEMAKVVGGEKEEINPKKRGNKDLKDFYPNKKFRDNST